MSNTQVIELASWFIYFYALNANIYIKRWLGKNTFRKYKPFDCYQCCNFWTAVVHQVVLYLKAGHINWHNALYMVSVQYLVAACIQTMVEGPARKVTT